MKSKLITALVTPFDKNKELDIAQLKLLVKDIENQGSDGIVLGGTTGEGSSLSEDELINIINAVSDITKMEIIINIGNNSTDKTIDMIRKIKNYKHDALMIIVPYYNKPTQKGIYEFCNWQSQICFKKACNCH